MVAKAVEQGSNKLDESMDSLLVSSWHVPNAGVPCCPALPPLLFYLLTGCVTKARRCMRHNSWYMPSQVVTRIATWSDQGKREDLTEQMREHLVV
jgi:hypothetical protein